MLLHKNKQGEGRIRRQNTIEIRMTFEFKDGAKEGLNEAKLVERV